MTDEVSVYLKGAAEQLYRAALELMNRSLSGELSPRELKEAVAALRELVALRELLTPPREEGGIRVVFEGAEDGWSQ